MLEKEGRLPDVVLACVGGGPMLSEPSTISLMTKTFVLSAVRQQDVV